MVHLGWSRKGVDVVHGNTFSNTNRWTIRSCLSEIMVNVLDAQPLRNTTYAKCRDVKLLSWEHHLSPYNSRKGGYSLREFTWLMCKKHQSFIDRTSHSKCTRLCCWWSLESGTGVICLHSGSLSVWSVHVHIDYSINICVSINIGGSFPKHNINATHWGNHKDRNKKPSVYWLNSLRLGLFNVRRNTY